MLNIIIIINIIIINSTTVNFLSYSKQGILKRHWNGIPPIGLTGTTGSMKGNVA